MRAAWALAVILLAGCLAVRDHGAVKPTSPGTFAVPSGGQEPPTTPPEVATATIGKGQTFLNFSSPPDIHVRVLHLKFASETSWDPPTNYNPNDNAGVKSIEWGLGFVQTAEPTEPCGKSSMIGWDERYYDSQGKSFGASLGGGTLPAGDYDLWSWNNEYQSPFVLVFQQGGGPRHGLDMTATQTVWRRPVFSHTDGIGPANPTLALPAANQSIVLAAVNVAAPLISTDSWSARLEGDGPSCPGVTEQGTAAGPTQAPPSSLFLAVRGTQLHGLKANVTVPKPVASVPLTSWSWSFDSLAFQH